jgi:hypothetical protein
MFAGCRAIAHDRIAQGAFRLLMAACVLILFLTACGEGEEAPTATPTATPPSVGSPSPGATETPPVGPSPTQPVNGGQPRVIDLATAAPLLTIFAIDEGDLRNDIPSLVVADFNGDGLDDILLGARFGDGPDDIQDNAGEAYVIFGSHDLSETIDLAQAEQDLTIFGARPGDNLGYGVGAADVNDDGIDDIIVAAPMSEGPLATQRTDRGEIYIIFGRADLSGVIDTAEGEQDVTITAAEGFSLLGDSIATGDVNDDGIDDIVLGAPFAGRVPGSPPGGPRTELGEVYAIFGSPALSEHIRLAEGEEDFKIVGPEQYSELGDAVAVGDVNGDGIDDIIAAAEAGNPPDGTRQSAGEAFVVFGSADLSGKVETAEGEQDLSILGVDANDALGFCVSSGDPNSDGIDDIVLVAQRAAGAGGTRDASGEAYLLFGSGDLRGTIDTRLGEQDTTIWGAHNSDLLSSCLASHDVNGDGIDDIVLGSGFANGPDRSRTGAGEAYVFLGSPDLQPVLDLAEGSEDILLFGAQPGDHFGAGLASGDINGDGRSEIILVASLADGPDDSRPDAGEVYAVTP